MTSRIKSLVAVAIAASIPIAGAAVVAQGRTSTRTRAPRAAQTPPRAAQTPPPAGTPAPAPAVAAPAAPQVQWDQFSALLRATVRGGGVDYSALRGRIAELRAFHDTLAVAGPRTNAATYGSGNARKAFWLNAYNASVLRGVAEAPASMNNVMNYQANSGFFRARSWQVDGRAITLDAMENREVRDVFHDPRVHMALNCAARSCPPLRNEAYTAGRVNAQLDDQSTRYINTAGNVAIDEAAHRVTLSQLFEWFRADFSGAVPGHAADPMQGPLAFVHMFANADLRARLERVCGADGRGCTVAFNTYDWALNTPR